MEPRWRRCAVLHGGLWSGGEVAAPCQAAAHHTFIAIERLHLKFKRRRRSSRLMDDAVAAVELARPHVTTLEFRPRRRADRSGVSWTRISKARVAAGARTVQHSGYGGLFDAAGICVADRARSKGAGRLRNCQRTLPTTI